MKTTTPDSTESNDAVASTAMKTTRGYPEQPNGSADKGSNSKVTSKNEKSRVVLARSVRWRVQLGLLQSLSEEERNDNANISEGIERENQGNLIQQRKRYQRLLQQFQQFQQEQQAEQEKEKDTATEESFDPLSKQPEQEKSSPSFVDPLTQMVQEQEANEKRLQALDLRYKQEKAAKERMRRQKQNQDSTPSLEMTLDMIQKDLHRLSPEHEQYFKILDDQSSTSRAERLTRLLSLFSHVHPKLNYRQGMHEIQSYILIVLEMELIQQKEKETKGEIPSRDSKSNNDDDDYQYLLDLKYIEHDAFALFECIMLHMQCVYDVGGAGGMPQIAQSVLLKIRHVAQDEQVYVRLQTLGCPPELYCTRWLRLLFSREVVGIQNVLSLWDVIFDLLSSPDLKGEEFYSMPLSNYTRPGHHPPLKVGGFDMLEILETMAASFILLQRNQLVSTQTSTEDVIHCLMNVQPLKVKLPLTATLLSMMRRLQLYGKHSNPPQNQPQPKFASARSKSAPSNGLAQMAQSAQTALHNGSESIRNFLHSSFKQQHPHQQQHYQQQQASPFGMDTPVPPQQQQEQQMTNKLTSATIALRDYIVQIHSTSGAPIPNHVRKAFQDLNQVRAILEQQQQGQRRR